MTEVILISMPFGPINTPSLGLSLLKSGLSNLGIKSTLKYYNIEFAKQIDLVDYIRISNGFPVNHDLLGEWLFSTFLFHKETSDLEQYFSDILLGNNSSHRKNRFNIDEISPNYLNALRNIITSIPNFISYCLKDVLKEKPKIVGFTSVFQQHVASLCLAREIKKHSPETVIVFGGANVESVMGIENIRQFDFIDYVVSGEGDKSFPELVTKILENEKEFSLHGVFDKRCLLTKPSRLATETISNMDETPIPCSSDTSGERLALHLH